MRILASTTLCLLVLGTAASAQKKVDTTWHCLKAATVQKLDVGDEPDHSYLIQQGTCTAASSKTGQKSGTYTEFHELWKDSFTFHGRYNATAENGDMTFYTYEGSYDPKKPLMNKWKIVNGTGKQKGTKGSGSCAGKANQDGSIDWDCTFPAGMAAKAKD
jgi:hypothetical protein